MRFERFGGCIIRPHRGRISALIIALMAMVPAARADSPALDVKLSTDVLVGSSPSPGGQAQRARPRQERKRALVLANVDDDAARCTAADAIVELRVTACNDSTDDVINGAADMADLAPLRLKPWRGAPANATGVVDIAPVARSKARLFAWREGRWQMLAVPSLLSADELRRGVEMRLEATDVVRDRRSWDGTIDVSVRVSDGRHTAGDAIRFSVAPLIVQSDIGRLKRVYLPGMPWGQDDPGGTTLVAPGIASNSVAPVKPVFGYRSILDAANPALGASQLRALTDPQPLGLLGRAFKAFHDEFSDAIELARPSARIVDLSTFEDPWVQDMFQMAYASVPRPGGRSQIMYVALRSPQPQRYGAQLPLTEVLGPDVGIIEQWVDDSGMLPESGDYSLNSTGNFGAIPPYRHRGRHYPLGRILYGAGDGWVMSGGGVIDSSIGGGELELRRRAPDSSFIRMLEEQRQQDAVAIDTAWLSVGHIDEIVAFVPANNARGWKVVVADPMRAWRILERIVARGGRDQPFRSGLEPWADGLVPEELTRTVGEVFDDPRLAAAQQVAQQKIDGVIATLKAETGIGDADLIRVPVLFEPTFFNDRSYLALTPNAANLVPLDNGRVAIARQHGPLVSGRDVFERVIEAAFHAENINVSWVEDFIQAHGGSGEIHCQSNVMRHPGRLAQWWRIR